MKTTVLWALFVIGFSSFGFAQGKVTFMNDVGSPIVLGDFPWVRAADASLAGQPVPTTGPLPSGVFLVEGLYAGTSSTSLALYTSVIVNPAGGTGNPAGVFTPTHVVFPWGGVLTYMQVKVWESEYPSYEAAIVSPYPSYLGHNQVFTMIPGTSIAYPSIINGGGSTWTSVGNEHSIVLGGPEPSTFSLVSLGAFMLLCFRRKTAAVP
jgi:hypothetical protein